MSNLINNLLLVSSITLPLLAVEDMKTLEVTTGTRTAKALSEAPIRTEVITKEEIKNIHAKDVSEAIKYVPGLLIKETHGKQGSGVWIQGFNSDRVLILLNGEPMTSSTGQTVDLNQLNVSDIEKIEIIKGAASALYGSQAMGGVINIITSRPKNGFNSSATLELGTYGSKSAEDTPVGLFKGSASYKNSSFESSLFADYRHENGIKLQEGYEYDLPEIDRVNINGEFRTLGKHQFFIKPRFYVEKSRKPFSSFAPGVGAIKEEKTEDVQKYRISVGSSSEFENSDNLKTTFFVERYIDDSYQSKLVTDYTEVTRKATIDMAQGDIQYDTALNESHLLTTGVQFRYQKLRQEQIKEDSNGPVHTDELGDNSSSNALEAYVQDDWFISEELELIPGVRYQYDSDFGSYTSPKLSLFYTPYQEMGNRFNIRASYGNGYRAPSLKERFFNFDHSYLGYMVLGNPNLEPESSNSYQLSAEWIGSSAYSLSVNFYYNDIRNLIDTQKNLAKSIISGLEIYEYVNVNAALTKGVEVEANTQFLKYFGLNGGYTYLYSEDQNTKKHLTQRPEHQVKATLSLKVSDTNAQVSAIYETEQYVDSANKLTSPATTQVDFKMTQHVTKLLSVYGGVNNLLNEHADPEDSHDLRTKRPRYIYAGATYNF